MNQETLRTVTSTVGIGSVAFGIVPLLSPRLFARLFGLAEPTDPTTAAAFRSVGVRDLAIGMGLWSAATHGGNFAPWLLARTICDAGDTLALLLAIRSGARDARFLTLTAFAAAASGSGLWLWRTARKR